jgi:hypothetical protein
MLLIPKTECLKRRVGTLAEGNMPLGLILMDIGIEVRHCDG